MPRSALARLARPAGSSLISHRIQAALGAVATLATIGLSQGSAQAYVVNVGGVQYDVTTFTGSYDNNTGNFQSGMMPWWGNQTAAMEFAYAVQTQVPYNYFGGPLFGYNPPIWFVEDGYRIGVQAVYYNYSVFPDNFFAEEDYVWAKATLVSRPAASAPGPLPILGAAAAFGASRKLRSRIKAIKVVASTATVV